MIATLQFNSKIVQLLICNQNLRINQRSKVSCLVVSYCSKIISLKFISFQKGNTALMLASYDGNSEIVKLLLTHENINIDLRNAVSTFIIFIRIFVYSKECYVRMAVQLL